MKGGDTFEERTVSFSRPSSHYKMVVSVDGRFLGCDEHGETQLTETISDDLMWRVQAQRLEHARSSLVLELSTAKAGQYHLLIDGAPLNAEGHQASIGAPYSIVHGPAQLPSEYLSHLTKNGWVCLAAILSPDIVDSLQRIACTDGYSARSPDRARRQICQGSALAKTAVEPISVWLARQYMQTDDIRLAHSPGIGVMTPDDGKRVVQGWHSDYPYHWGINAAGKVPTPSGKTVMGVQRIVCVSEFTKYRGATAFKLGSHELERGPPEEWGVARDAYQKGHRASNGLPYNGPDADVIEAPAGSMILFDTRTWHRAGINRSDQNRGAILMDMTPAYIVPYSDTTRDYRALIESEAYDELNGREQREFQRLMIHRFLGPAGPQSVIGTDEELTERLPLRARSSY
ncbi:MAG: phytanoyl-CoA dioxygenase family protein [Gammaproteobacteria bacterium]|nr:phytanoyl-CoA dioxygenase family protein [Gammaproteobacteria bacterium]